MRVSESDTTAFPECANGPNSWEANWPFGANRIRVRRSSSRFPQPWPTALLHWLIPKIRTLLKARDAPVNNGKLVRWSSEAAEVRPILVDLAGKKHEFFPRRARRLPR